MGVNYSGTYSTPRLDLGVTMMEHVTQMNEFIGAKVLPVFRTPKQAADYSVITKETILQRAVARRAARANYNRINFGAKDRSYRCEEFGLEIPVDDQERALYMSDFDAESAAMQVLGRVLALEREIRVKDAVFNTTTFTGASLFTDKSGTPWSTASTDWIAHVLDAKELVRKNCGMVPDSLVIGAETLTNLYKNTKTKDQFKGIDVITLEALERAILSVTGLRNLIVGNARFNSAAEGETFSGDDVWSKKYAMVAVLAPGEGAALPTPSLGRSFLWIEDSPVDYVVEMYREEQSRGDIFRARHNLHEKINDPNFGHLLQVEV